MALDKDLFFANNARATIIPGANWSYGLFTGYIDFQKFADWSRGNVIYGCYRIATAFDSVAANKWIPSCFVDDNELFTNITGANGPQLCIASAGTRTGAVGSATDGYPSTSLTTQGRVFQIALPPANDILRALGDSVKMLTLGIQVYAPAADWAAGGMDVWLSPYPWNPLPSSRPSGF
jgi:hypothetical protein